jgi:hypothetical protein
MPQTKNQAAQPQTDNTALILATIALIAAIALGIGYYFYSQNKPETNEVAPTIVNTPTTEPMPEPEQVTEPTTTPTTVVTPTTTTSTAPNYTNWKTYTYRAPGGGGFSVKYPPGFAVGQERTKDETYFTIFPSPNPLNKPEVMHIYYEGTGNVRFAQPSDSDEWSYYDQVVQSFQKIK